MPLTPADVHNVTFSKSSIGKRGYKEDEVDVFLDLVGAELARLIEINKDLRDEIERLGQQLRTEPAIFPLETPREVTAPLRTETLDRQSRENAESLERDSSRKMSVGNGLPDGRAIDEPGAIRKRWQPAV